MRQIDNMNNTEIDILHLKGMLSTTAPRQTQQGKTDEEMQSEHDNDLRWEAIQSEVEEGRLGLHYE